MVPPQLPLAEQPLMQNVLADLAIEAEAGLASALWLASTFESDVGETEAALSRLATPALKFWLCKRAPMVVAEFISFFFATTAAELAGGARDLYGLVTSFFHRPLNVAFYEICLVLLGFHLWHGFSSAFESLGGDEPRYTPRVVLTGKILAVVIAGGFVIIPLWVFFTGGRS